MISTQNIGHVCPLGHGALKYKEMTTARIGPSAKLLKRRVFFDEKCIPFINNSHNTLIGEQADWGASGQFFIPYHFV